MFGRIRRLQLISSVIFIRNRQFATFDLMAPVTRKRTIATSVNTDDAETTVKKVSTKVRAEESKKGKDGLPMIPFPSPDDLENWLKINHTCTTGIWVKIAKKSTGIPSITYEQMLDVALCFGWIDGQRSGLDETWFLQRITPRRPKSNWSQINREKVKRLIKIGKMQSPGQISIDEAKADGRWDNASKPSSGCVVPDELQAEIEVSSTSTQETFKKLSKESKLAIISQIEQATITGNGAECIQSIVEMLDRGEKPLD